MLFCRWDEAPQVNLFFTLRNHTEWQEECRMIPRDSFVMVLEKDRKIQEKTGMKKGCLACSSGKLCAKHANTPLGLLEQEEGVDLLVSPRVQGEGGGSSSSSSTSHYTAGSSHGSRYTGTSPGRSGGTGTRPRQCSLPLAQSESKMGIRRQPGEGKRKKMRRRRTVW